MTTQFLKDNSKYVFEDRIARREGDDSKFDKRGYTKFLDNLDGTKLEEFKENESVFTFPSSEDNPAGVEDESTILEFKKNKQELYTGNIVGFLGDGKGHTLQIKSRFSSDGNETDFFFQYMLEKVLDVPLMIENFGTTYDKQKPYMLEWLMLLFPKYLKDAMRKGLFKQYVKREYNDANVRGVIDVSRHIKTNIPFLGKIAYTQREHTVDNELMQLVRHTVEFIKCKSSGANLLANVKDEVGKVVEATPTYSQGQRRRVLIQNKNRPVAHAYYHEYRELQRLCIAILQHETMQIGTGKDEIFGILFDCAWLWEEYVNTLIGDKFHHPENKTGYGQQLLFRPNKQGEAHIYPDFIGKNPKNRIIADAKYKYVGGIGKDNGDYFQLLSYMFRFDANTGYFIYPDSKPSENDGKFFLLQGSTFDEVSDRNEKIKVVKLGLQIPQNADNYADFCEKIDKNEKAFVKKVK